MDTTTISSSVEVETKNETGAPRESKKDSPMAALANQVKGIPNLGDIC